MNELIYEQMMNVGIEINQKANMRISWMNEWVNEKEAAKQSPRIFLKEMNEWMKKRWKKVLK